MIHMFFRREKQKVVTFGDRIANLEKLGFATQSENAGSVRVLRHGCGATISDTAKDKPSVGKAGLAIGKEIGILVDGGYQKFFLTPSGVKEPALAPQLKALHAFEEDLREGLGLTSLYNESLGTTFSEHLYDRVQDRDRGVPHRPWEK